MNKEIERYPGELSDLRIKVEDLKAKNLLLRKDNHDITETLYNAYKRIKDLNDDKSENNS